MKKLAITTLLALAAVSCNVNEDYDLSNLETGNVGLGSEESQFEAPLATITIDVTDLVEGGGIVRSSRAVALPSFDKSTIDQYIDDYSAMLPESYVEQGLDLNLVVGEDDQSDEYRNKLVVDLVDEAAKDSAKAESLAQLIVDNESKIDPTFKDDIETATGVQISNDNFTQTFVEELASDDSKINDIAKEHLTTFVKDKVSEITDAIKDQEIREKVDGIEVPEDILSMITDNLDGDNCSLRIFTKKSHNIPFEFALKTPELLCLSSDDKVTFTDEVKDGNETGRLVSQEITSDQLTSLLRGMTVVSSIDITKFIPNSSSTGDQGGDTSGDQGGDTSGDQSGDQEPVVKPEPKYYIKFYVGMIKTGVLVL